MSISGALRKLQLPPLHLNNLNADEHPEQDQVIHEWKRNAKHCLISLKDLLAHTDADGLTDGEVADIVAKATPFTGNDIWTSESMHVTANEIIAKLPLPTLEVVTLVLYEHIKPRFSRTPHPRLNAASGRRLPRPAGGSSAAQDFYEDQEWKAHPGTANVLLWCVQRLKREDYESVWHLVIPPTMTLLDDYETCYKLKGVELVSELLQHVPPDFLKRTGVDGLLITSLRASMVHLHTPLTPKLLQKSIPTLLRLISCTTLARSKARFDQICALLGDGIIGGIWIYASDDLETIEASTVVLPDVLRELGIGSVRYLKTLIPQMVHNLTPLDFRQRCISLQIASLRALEVIIEVCRPRISNWKGSVIEGLAKCWVSLEDATFSNDKESMELRSALRRVSLALAKACPSVVEDEYMRLLLCDKRMFHGLVSLEFDVR